MEKDKTVIICSNHTVSEVVELLKEAKGKSVAIIDPLRLSDWLEELHIARNALYEIRIAAGKCKVW